MKKHNENNEERKPDQNDRRNREHSVETPAPPQVMDPSEHPSNDERKISVTKDKKKQQTPDKAPDRKQKSEGEKLAPAEEL